MIPPPRQEPKGRATEGRSVEGVLFAGGTGGADVQTLNRYLAPGGSEFGLFVTPDAHSIDAQLIARTQQGLRLSNSNDLVDPVFRCYDGLQPEYK